MSVQSNRITTTELVLIKLMVTRHCVVGFNEANCTNYKLGVGIRSLLNIRDWECGTHCENSE